MIFFGIKRCDIDFQTSENHPNFTIILYLCGIAYG